jgi:EpsI family protein
LNQLKVDDYLLADFHHAADPPVDLWVAYYGSQRKGRSSHSPESCLPGNGWEFVSAGTRRLGSPGAALMVNRAVIAHGADRELMYYWFQQRGRVLTNEYVVKWYILWDALTRNRTDGALVRLIAPIPPGETEAAADRDLSEFAGMLARDLPRYVPN